MKDVEILNRASAFIVPIRRDHQFSNEQAPPLYSSTTQSDSKSQSSSPFKLPIAENDNNLESNSQELMLNDVESTNLQMAENRNHLSRNKYHIVTCSHVAAPWKWPKYYPDEWLQALNETHTAYSLELRQDNGIFAYQQLLQPMVFHHPSKDMCAVHFDPDDEEAAVKMFLELGAQIYDVWNSPQQLQEGHVRFLVFYCLKVFSLIDYFAADFHNWA